MLTLSGDPWNGLTCRSSCPLPCLLSAVSRLAALCSQYKSQCPSVLQKSEQMCISGPMPVSTRCHGTGKVCAADLTALQALQFFSLACQTHATYMYRNGRARVLVLVER